MMSDRKAYLSGNNGSDRYVSESRAMVGTCGLDRFKSIEVIFT